jgi:hypothetical protein
MIEAEERIFIEIHKDALGTEELSVKLLRDIINLWQAKSWDDSQLFHYITQRFGRPLRLLSLAELRVIKDELV